MLKIRVLGVPLDLGQERRGVDMGPLAVRAAGLNQALKSLGMKFRTPQHSRAAAGGAGFCSKTAKYLKEIAETSQEVAERVYQTLEAATFP